MTAQQAFLWFLLALETAAAVPLLVACYWRSKAR